MSDPLGFARGGDEGAASDPELLSTREVAAIFRRTDRTIRSWVMAGHLHPLRIGRSVFFKRRDVEALLGIKPSSDDLSSNSEIDDSS